MGNTCERWADSSISSSSLICFDSRDDASDRGCRVRGQGSGDTIEVMHENHPERVRLNGIDCPEKAQAFGTKAKEFTSNLCFGKTVQVEEHGHDRYGRTIGEIRTGDNKDVNHELVAAGMAWWYRKYAPKDSVLQELEETAKREKRGLWADPAPVAPWDFRHKKM